MRFGFAVAKVVKPLPHWLSPVRIFEKPYLSSWHVTLVL